MLKDSTYTLQSRMAGYCRDGKSVELPVDSEERLSHYRRLVFNVVKGILEQSYPVATRHLPSDMWNQLVIDFFAEHNCQDPQVWRMPKELIDFVKNNPDRYSGIPYLSDLLRMEWLEIEVHSMPDKSIPNPSPIGDMLNQPLVFNPHFRLEQFEFPVHQIHQLDPAKQTSDFFLLVFREEETGKVQFIQLQPFMAVFLDTLMLNPTISAVDAAESVCQTTGHVADQLLFMQIEALLNHLYVKKFIMGSTAG